MRKFRWEMTESTYKEYVAVSIDICPWSNEALHHLGLFLQWNRPTRISIFDICWHGKMVSQRNSFSQISVNVVYTIIKHFVLHDYDYMNIILFLFGLTLKPLKCWSQLQCLYKVMRPQVGLQCNSMYNTCRLEANKGSKLTSYLSYLCPFLVGLAFFESFSRLLFGLICYAPESKVIR